MIFVDAREGLSGDMLLASMIGLLDGEGRNHIVDDMTNAGRSVEVRFDLLEVEDGGETGLGVSFTGKGIEPIRRSYRDAKDLLDSMHVDRCDRDDDRIDRKILERLFQAEAKAHSMPIDDVHLHEIGRASALLNMYGIGRAYTELERLGAGEFVSSTVVTGSGIIVIAHGAMRVPAPACKLLLNGFKHETGSEPGERATPTGIAALRTLSRSQSNEIPTEYRARSVGFGTKRFGGRLGRTVSTWL